MIRVWGKVGDFAPAAIFAAFWLGFFGAIFAGETPQNIKQILRDWQTLVAAIVALLGVVISVTTLFVIRHQQAEEDRRKERAKLWAIVGEDVMALHRHQAKAQIFEMGILRDREGYPIEDWAKFSRKRRERLKLHIGLNINSHIVMLDRAMDRIAKGDSADASDDQIEDVISLAGRKRSCRELDHWCQLALKGGDLKDMAPFVFAGATVVE